MIKSSVNNIEFSKLNLTHFLVGAILICSLLYLPIISADFTSLHRAIAVSLATSIYGLYLIFSKQRIKLTLADLGWLSLISLSFLSSLWSLNPFHALFGGFSTLLVYLCYKLFEGCNWTVQTQRWLSILMFVFVAFALGIIIYSNFILPKKYGQTGFLSGMNDHYMASLVLVSSPYILIVKRKYPYVIASSLILISIAIVIYKVGSLQVFLGSMITCIYLIVSLTRASLKRILFIMFSASIIVLLSSAVFMLKKDSMIERFELLREFDTQNDRKLMWKNSFELFKKRPLLGVGKNNWRQEVRQYGNNEFRRWSNKRRQPTMFHHPHSWFFHIISELGILGLLSYLLIGLSCIQSILKNKVFDGLTYTAIFSLLSFLWVGLMYGVVYNRFNSFVGLPILAVLCLSIINVNSKQLITLGARLSGALYILGSIACFIYFLCAFCGKQEYDNGFRLVKRGKGTEALRVLEPENVYWDLSQVSRQAAYASEQIQNLPEAIRYYNMSIRQNPYDALLLYEFSKTLYRHGNYEEALHYSYKVYDLCNRYEDNNHHLLDCLEKRGDSEKLISQACKIKKLRELVNKILNNNLSNYLKNRPNFKPPKDELMIRVTEILGPHDCQSTIGQSKIGK